MTPKEAAEFRRRIDAAFKVREAAESKHSGRIEEFVRLSRDGAPFADRMTAADRSKLSRAELVDARLDVLDAVVEMLLAIGVPVEGQEILR